jgi:hypothetical protein
MVKVKGLPKEIAHSAIRGLKPQVQYSGKRGRASILSTSSRGQILHAVTDPQRYFRREREFTVSSGKRTPVF